MPARETGQPPAFQAEFDSAPSPNIQEFLPSGIRVHSMGDWIRTRDLETKMGMAKAGSFATLVRYESAGLVERRPYQNLPYNQRRGWEWRWIG